MKYREDLGTKRYVSFTGKLEIEGIGFCNSKIIDWVL